MRPDVSLICIADRPQHLPVLVHSLIAQTFTRWELIVLDQLEGSDEIARFVNRLGDDRIWRCPVARVGDWGMTAKEYAARELTEARLVGFPNDDAYYAPVFLERLITGAEDARLDLVYCDWIFDKMGYLPMPVRPVVGHIDVGGFLVKRSALLEVGWGDKGQTGDGILVQELVAKGYRHGRVSGCLYVKN